MGSTGDSTILRGDPPHNHGNDITHNNQYRNDAVNCPYGIAVDTCSQYAYVLIWKNSLTVMGRQQLPKVPDWACEGNRVTFK